MRFTKLLIVILTLIVFSSCKKEQPSISPENFYKFKEYVAEVTTGVVSTNSEIKVVLMNPVSEWNTNTELDGSLLKITPKVKGKVTILNNRTIAFIPEKRFEQDTRYTFALDLGNIQEVPKEFNTFEFDIKTIKQEVSVSTNYLQSYDKNWQYLEGTLKSSDNLLVTTAQQLITATQKEKNLAIKIDSDVTEGKYFHFKIDSIQRFDKNSDIEIIWDGEPFDIDSKGDFDFEIPGKNNFTVIKVNTFDEKSKYIEINFSDPLDQNQNFNGLVTLEGVNSIKYSVDGNILKAYPLQKVDGNKELKVHRGVKSTDGYKIRSSFSQDISFEALKPEVRLLQNGTILPTSEDLKFNFEAVGLKAVDVTILKIYEDNVLQFLQDNELNGSNELRRVARPIAKKTINLEEHASNLNNWNAFAVDLKTIINPNPGAIYRVRISFKKQHSLYKCEGTDDYLVTEQADNYDAEDEETSYWDSGYYNNNYNYNWSDRDNPCSTSYYRNKEVSANILASNLGVTVKKGSNNSYFVAVSDIITTSPVANAQVTFYNFQQQVVGKQKTDNEGQLNFDANGNVYFATVTKDKHTTYVKLKDGNALSVSKFDVSGVQLKKGLKGYIYGERGVWRPGDTLFLSFMLNDKANKLPKGHPVKLEIKNPYGVITHRAIKTGGLNNFYAFKVPTDIDDATGNWNATVSVGGAKFTKRIKIETIKPNRLKIKAALNNDIIKSQRTEKGTIEVAWLHGAIARNLKADINVKFSQKKTEFKTFPGFEFNDPTSSYSNEKQVVFKGRINDDGKVNFSFKPSKTNNAPGMLKASFVTKVYENGGDFSTDVFSTDYSPYDSYVGLLTPKGDAARGMLLTDTNHRFDVATVDEKGVPIAVENLVVKIYKVNQNWWWNESENNLSSFNSGSYRDEVFSKNISTNSSGKTSFEYELKYPEWGRYLVHVINRDSGHSTGKTVFIDWPGWAGKARKGDPSAATMLSFATDKTTYNVGEKAIVTFPSSASGRALVTIENGTEVLQGFWIKAKKGDTKFELPITKEMTPNVFIHISLLQTHNNTKNDLPIRMYGLSAITVENPDTRLYPKISMPNVLQPEQEVTIKVSEKNGKPMTYSIAIVDEGLLDLTRYKTPNPWHTFFSKEALGVKTWDIFDDVIGAFGGRINQVFSIGGDGMLAGGKNKKANRFKPVVLYLGPFEIGKNDTEKHTVKLPKYVGSVRTMVVAHNPETEAYGSTEKATPVRKPLMVLASMARKVTPGEKVRIPITVFAMEKKMKNVKLSLKLNDVFKIVGNTTQQLHFANPDEKMAYFDVEVLKNGIGTIEVIASGHGEKASYSLELDAINPNPETSETIDIILAPNSTQKIDFNTFGVLGTNNAQIELSSLPSIDFNARLQYLIKYPHGCVEQTTSGAFPQLFLNDIFDLSDDKKLATQKNIQIAINKLAKFQIHNGAFSYWQGQNSANDWATSYVGHFLLEAENKGFVLPLEFKNKWIDYQKQASKKWRKSADRSALAQAYRLYTLALAGKADNASMNRLRESNDLPDVAKLRLAAAYALIGQKNASNQLIDTVLNVENTSDDTHKSTYGSAYRDKAMALETYTILKEHQKSKELAEQLGFALSGKNYMSTQTTAYSLLAMSKYAAFIGGKGVHVNYATNGERNKNVKTSKSLASRELTIQKGTNSLSITNTKDNTIYVRILNNGILPIGEEKIAQRNLVATSIFKTKDGSAINPSKINQGTDFVAEITIKNTKGVHLKDVALSTIFPSGWEIVNTRFTDFGDFADNNVTHEDIRDDRTNFYFDLKAFETKTVRVLLNASYLGSYYLPGVQCETMYDDDYFVRTKGQWVEVIK